MKTFQSITSLATSPANSSYSLYSNGFVVTTPESVQDPARSQSIHNLSYYQQQSAHPALPNGHHHMRHSFSSDSDSRNRLDLDQALEVLQRQQVYMHSTKAPSSSQRVYISQNGGGAAVDDDDDALSVENTRL